MSTLFSKKKKKISSILNTSIIEKSAILPTSIFKGGTKSQKTSNNLDNIYVNESIIDSALKTSLKQVFYI